MQYLAETARRPLEETTDFSPFLGSLQLWQARNERFILSGPESTLVLKLWRFRHRHEANSLPSCKCIFIKPFLRVILREERSFRCLGKYFRKRRVSLLHISAWGQLWAEMGIGGAGSREWGPRGGDESGSGSSFLSNGSSHQLAHGWSVEGRVIFVTWRGRRCGFILTSASFATWVLPLC